MPDGTTGQNMEFALRPAFVGWATVLAQIPYHLVFAVLALNFGGFLGAAMSEPPDRTISYAYFLVPPAIVLAVSPFLMFRAKCRRYRQTEYRFFHDRLQLGEGYVFHFRNVKTVTLSRGLFGRISGLGTLRLVADIQGFEPLSAQNGLGVVTKDGIVLKDIPNPDQALMRIRALLDAQNH